MKRISMMCLLAAFLSGCVADAKGPPEPPKVLDNMAAANELIALGCIGKLQLVAGPEGAFEPADELRLNDCKVRESGRILYTAAGRAHDDYTLASYYWIDGRDFARANSAEVRAVEWIYPWALDLSRKKRVHHQP